MASRYSTERRSYETDSYSRTSNDQSAFSRYSSSANYSSAEDVKRNNELTEAVVSEVKYLLNNREDPRTRVDQREMEMIVFNAKNSIDEQIYNIAEVERTLSAKIPRIKRDVLMAAMAYGSNIKEFEDYYRMLTSTSTDNSMRSGSDGQIDLSDAIRPLTQLRDELNQHKAPLPHLIVRGIEAKDQQFANRVFYSEIYHHVPQLTQFTMEDADGCVKAIQKSSYVIQTHDELLGLVKTCEGDEADDYLKRLERENYGRNQQNTTTTTTTAMYPSSRDSFDQDRRYRQ